MFVGATSDGNDAVSAGCALPMRLFVWTSLRFHVVSVQLMFPFLLSTQVIFHCDNFALLATCFVTAVFCPFLRNSICALWLTHQVLCLGLKPGISAAEYSVSECLRAIRSLILRGLIDTKAVQSRISYQGLTICVINNF